MIGFHIVTGGFVVLTLLSILQMLSIYGPVTNDKLLENARLISWIKLSVIVSILLSIAIATAP